MTTKKIGKQKIVSLLLLVLFLAVGGFYYARPALTKYALGKADYYFSDASYNLESAKRWYQVGRFLDPSSQAVHYQLARIYFLQGKFDIARKEINIEIEKFPDFKRSYYVRGLINGYDKKFAQAIGDFNEFLKWKPASWAAHNDLAWVYFQIGDFLRVSALADDGLKYNPDNPWLLNTKGLALYNLNKKEEAKEYFVKALAEAGKLGIKDWQTAYPGNDPAFASQGLEQMLNAIKANNELAI